jgi:hypothetical protein
VSTETESLPPIFSPQRFFLDAPKQPRGTCFVLNTDFQLAMGEIERLRAENASLRAEMAHYEGQEDDDEALRRG